jgi:FixJ family two-component response regulator
MDGFHRLLTSGADNLEEVKASDARLSPREHAVVLLMGHGLSNKEIARRFRIAPETVKRMPSTSSRSSRSGAAPKPCIKQRRSASSQRRG